MALKRKPTPRSSFLDKVLGRLDRLDSEGLQSVVQRLARERAFLETLFNSIEDGVVVVDAHGRIAYFNAVATRLIGLPEEGCEGEEILRYIPDLDWPRIAALDGTGSPGIYREEFEVNYPRPRYLRLYAAPMDGGGNGSAGVALILHDATEARQKTNKAVEIERLHALTLLAASVAHEIGNPLNALHIHLQLVERGLRKLRLLSGVGFRDEESNPRSRTRRRSVEGLNDPDLEETFDKTSRYLAVAKGEIGRLDYIITEFLQALRPTPPKFEAADLNTVVKATVELLRPELDNRRVVVREELMRGLPEARFDPVQIKQVLVNLMKNALHALSPEGVLTLATGMGPDAVWVSVADNGVGIPQETLSRIFEPFYTTKQKGSGLGLMIVQRILRDHGGRMELTSHVGRGTTFRFWIPRVEPRPRLLAG
jgi:two-component system, sporulation sensor kinase E